MANLSRLGDTRRFVLTVILSLAALGCSDDDEPGDGGGGGKPTGGTSGEAGSSTGGSAGDAGEGGEGNSGAAGSPAGGSATGGSAGESGAGDGGVAGETGGGGTGGSMGGAGAGMGGAGAGMGGAGAGMGGAGAGMGGGGSGGCNPSYCCVKVAPDGDDGLAEANDGATPFQTIQPAIDFAAAHRELGTRVCVAAGPACSNAATFSGPSGSDLEMRDGISVYGGYESSAFTRCDPLSPTTLVPTTAAGVVFESDVQSETTLDGFTIEPFDATTTAGVTARGASGVRLVAIRIFDEEPVDWYGIDLIDSDATVTGLYIDTLQTTGQAIGVRAIVSRVALDGTIGVRGAGGEVYGLWLEGAFDSEIRANVTVANATDATAAGGLRVTGEGEGIEVSASSFTVTGQTLDTFGVSLLDCNGGAPVIAETTIVVDGRAAGNPIHGFRSIGDCHPTLEGSSIDVRGVDAQVKLGALCQPLAGTASRCILAGNTIRTSDGRSTLGPSVYGTGVTCGPGSCERISDNSIIGLDVPGAGCYRSCYYEATGIDLTTTNTLVAGNVIRAGCGDRAAGIKASGSPTEGPVRIENNMVFGRQCGPISDGVFTSAAIVSGGYLDVHSNTLDGGGTTNPANTCESAAVIGGSGEYRNNIFRPGDCPYKYGFANTMLSYSPPGPGSSGFPSALENNLFDPFGAWALYVVDSMTTITSIEGVNQLPFSTNNIAAQPALTGDGHLTEGSPCIDSGTSELAPLLDIDGEARDLQPDIGADEWLAPE